MGFGGISPWSLLLILVIVLALFGTKRLRNVGGDLGAAIKGFKKAVKEESADKPAEAIDNTAKSEQGGETIDVKPTAKETDKG